MRVNAEFQDLQQITRSIGVFKRNLNLPALKLHFFEKMHAAIAADDIEKAQLYFGYVKRAVVLSESVYGRMDEQIIAVRDMLNQVSLSSVSSQFGEIFSFVYISSQFLLKQTIQLTQELEQSHLFQTLLHFSNQQKEMLSQVFEKQGFLFDELREESHLHELFKLEFTESKKSLDAIDEYVKNTTSLLQRLKPKFIVARDKFLTHLQSVNQHPVQTIGTDAYAIGKVLEEHASLVATLIMISSGTYIFAGLLGKAELAAIAESVVVFFATTGESFQSLPAVKKASQKVKAKISPCVEFVHRLLGHA